MKWWKRREPVDLVGEAVASYPVVLDTPKAYRHTEPTIANAWCAPSEVLYGLLDIPELTVRRGGIQHR